MGPILQGKGGQTAIVILAVGIVLTVLTALGGMIAIAILQDGQSTGTVISALVSLLAAIGGILGMLATHYLAKQQQTGV